MPVRTNLAALRKGRGFGATELARMAGISRQTLHAIEAGAYVPNTAVALRLAQTLGVGVEAIFALEEENRGDGALPARLIERLDTSVETAARLPVQLIEVGSQRVAVPAVHSEHFIEPYDAVLKHPGPGLEMTFEALGDGDVGKGRLLIAGCDPATPVLVRHSAAAGIDVVAWHGNSSQALQLLREGLIHVAGCHFGGNSNEPAIEESFGSGGGEVSVVTLASWEEGFVVAAENPKSIRTVADLANPAVTVVNREVGAGSRKVFDRELQKAGMLPESVKGYDRTAPAHLAGAREVLEGRADCCIAPGIVARALGLDFVPLLTERYDLVFRREFTESGLLQTFLNTLTSVGLRRKLSALGRYDTSATGKTVR